MSENVWRHTATPGWSLVAPTSTDQLAKALELADRDACSMALAEYRRRGFAVYGLAGHWHAMAAMLVERYASMVAATAEEVGNG